MTANGCPHLPSPTFVTSTFTLPTTTPPQPTRPKPTITQPLTGIENEQMRLVEEGKGRETRIAAEQTITQMHIPFFWRLFLLLLGGGWGGV